MTIITSLHSSLHHYIYHYMVKAQFSWNGKDDCLFLPWNPSLSRIPYIVWKFGHWTPKNTWKMCTGFVSTCLKPVLDVLGHFGDIGSILGYHDKRKMMQWYISTEEQLWHLAGEERLTSVLANSFQMGIHAHAVACPTSSEAQLAAVWECPKVALLNILFHQNHHTCLNTFWYYLSVIP